MISQWQNKIAQLPDSPGVYFFMQGRKILYIGKASSLRQRVRSYFTDDLAVERGERLVKMLALARGLRFTPTNSAVEALILESVLIKKHQPPYNSRAKDDKSYVCLVITKEKWPRVLIVRQKDLSTVTYSIGSLFGPFTSGRDLRLALKIVRKIFPFRDSCRPIEERAGTVSPRPCFHRQLSLCPGVCTGEISRPDYLKLLRHLKLFFSGKSSLLLAQLTSEMKRLAKRQHFEQANEIKKQLIALQHINDTAMISADWLVDKPDRPTAWSLEAYDVAHLSGRETVGALVVVRDGETCPKSYRRFRLTTEIKGGDDLAALTQLVNRRLKHVAEWPLADMVVIDGGATHWRLAKKLFTGLPVMIVAVVKDEHHRPKEILGLTTALASRRQEILLANAEAHRFALSYHRRLRRQVV